MNFKTVAEAFNFYKGYTLEQLEQRAAEIKGLIERDANVDINALNIELTGIKEAKDNLADKGAEHRAAGVNLITGQSQGSQPTFNADTVADTPEYRNAFYKTLMGQKLTDVEQRAFNVAAEKRSDAYSTSSEVAAVIPTSTLNQVISKARTMGGLIAEARAFNMPTKISIPIATPTANASWHTEGADVDTTEPSISYVAFDGYEILKIFSISVKVKTMSVSAFESYLVDELTACVMGTIDAALVNGTGSGQGSGLETITWVKTAGATQNAVEVAAASEIEYEDVVATAALLKRGYAMGAKWAMNNKTLYNVFFNMYDSNKHPIYIAEQLGNQAAGSVGRILGFEVVIDDNIADNAVYLGNYNKYLGYNIPGGITVESSRDSSFKSGRIDYRAMAIADCKPIIAEAFVKLYQAAASN